MRDFSRDCGATTPQFRSPASAFGARAASRKRWSRASRTRRPICCDWSAGTHAGLLAGLWGNHAEIPVTGISVRRSRGEQEALVTRLAHATADLLRLERGPLASQVQVRDEWVGPGYSLPTDSMIEAVQMLAREEGVLLDPVYTGKAMAGLIGLIRSGVFRKGQNVLFLHTGGSPALFAYQSVLDQK